MSRPQNSVLRWLSVLVDWLRILWLQTIPGSRSSAMIVIVFLAVLGNCQRSHVANLVLVIKLSAHFVQALEFLLFMKGSRENVSERGKKHLSEFHAGLSTNAMVIHNRILHASVPSLNFEMKAVKTFTTPLERQLDEALRIKNSEADVLMNSGSEWRLGSIA